MMYKTSSYWTKRRELKNRVSSHIQDIIESTPKRPNHVVNVMPNHDLLSNFGEPSNPALGLSLDIYESVDLTLTASLSEQHSNTCSMSNVDGHATCASNVTSGNTSNVSTCRPNISSANGDPPSDHQMILHDTDRPSGDMPRLICNTFHENTEQSVSDGSEFDLNEETMTSELRLI